MAKRNRVAPTGELVAMEQRGTLMGNRGGARALRNGDIGSGTDAWIACTLAYTRGSAASRGTSRYMKLFFHDEATALAAGHRPCARCRPGAYDRFVELWRGAVGAVSRIGDVDGVLAEQRSGPREVAPDPESLPLGAAVELDGVAHVQTPHGLRAWSPGTGADGYAEDVTTSWSRSLLLTPPATIEVLAAGYVPAFVGT